MPPYCDTPMSVTRSNAGCSVRIEDHKILQHDGRTLVSGYVVL